MTIVLTPREGTSPEQIAHDLRMMDEAYQRPPGAARPDQLARAWLLGSQLGLGARPVLTSEARADEVISALEKALADKGLLLV